MVFQTEAGYVERLFQGVLGTTQLGRGAKFYRCAFQVNPSHYAGTFRGLDPHSVAIPWTASNRWGRTVTASRQDPTLVLGNLMVPNDHWRRAAARTTRHPLGRPVHSVHRLLGLMRVTARATYVARPRRGAGREGSPTLLILPQTDTQLSSYFLGYYEA